MKYLLTLSFAVLISLNAFSQGFSSKQGGNCYTLDIPEYMTRTYDLNEVATLQYQNTFKEAYVIVIEDSKDELEKAGIKFITAKEFLENFAKDYLVDAKKRKAGPITEFTANGNDHAYMEFTWESDDTDLFMLVTGVETENHFYKIMCWTIKENVDMLKNDFLTISRSLKD